MKRFIKHGSLNVIDEIYKAAQTNNFQKIKELSNQINDNTSSG